MTEPLLSVKDLRMHFPITEGIVRRRHVGEVKAVDGIDFTVARGETLGLVGESGCGKTTTGRCILRLERPTGGAIVYDGVDIATLSEKDLVKLRQKIQVIFQDPFLSLNPRMKVGQIIAEPMYVHGIEPDAAKRKARVLELLSVCGLNARFADRYPHEMSGGQRQRVGIARALAVDPDVLLMDEPFGALDAITRTMLQDELVGLWEGERKTVLFVTHDLDEATYLGDRILILGGKPGRLVRDVQNATPRLRPVATDNGPSAWLAASLADNYEI